MMNFHIMKMVVVQEMLDSGTWDRHYTTEDIQKSGDGKLIAVAGVQTNTVKSFTTSIAMFEWCYNNGWTKPVEDSL